MESAFHGASNERVYKKRAGVGVKRTIALKVEGGWFFCV